jgi:hypothetical protein
MADKIWASAPFSICGRCGLSRILKWIPTPSAKADGNKLPAKDTSFLGAVVQRYFLFFKIFNRFFWSCRLSQKAVTIICSSVTL